MLRSASRPKASTTRIARSALTATASLMVLAAAAGGLAPARAQNAADPTERRLFILDPTQIQNQPQVRTPVTPAAVAPGAGLGFTRTERGAPMQVNAGQMVYEEQSGRVSARGNVQIYYDGRTIEADVVTYDQRSGRVRATGNVRITEPSGIIAHAQDMEFDQQFTQGFVRSLNIETPDRRFIGAAEVTRENGDTTIFERATYTACDSCRADQSKPPTWTIKAKRIIHRESERTIYFEDGRFEMFGVPIAYMPRFWAPDPTVRKASGFLMPGISGSNRTGVGVEVPYFWNVQPNYDLLIAPRYYARQGFMPIVEWRHGFESGYYTIRAAGIRQNDPGVFTYSNGTNEVGNREFRGIIHTTGIYRLTERWSVGWDLNLMSDTAFLRDYSLMLPGQTEANSRLFLRGQGPRSWFDLSATRYVGITATDTDNKILPTTHPVLDYFKVMDQSVVGGELSWRTSVVSLTREAADVSRRNPLLDPGLFCNRNVPGSVTPANCLVNGIDGLYSRASAEVAWRRRIIDGMGQVWEPFVSARGDVTYHQLKDNSAVLGSFSRLAQDDRVYTRFMPTVGITYRYPWIAANPYGTTTIEPVVQFIARPNETNIGNIPNEDAQSLVFDDTNLFQVNKFSGWDRVEGGGRMNYGLNLTHRFTNGSSVNVLFGQSLHLFGINSFSSGAINDMASTGANSGLDKPRSDYVARIQYQIDRNFRLSARGRFDERTFAMQRGEFDATGRFGDFALTGTFGYLAPQPLLGYQVARSSVGAAMSYSLTQTLTVYGAARFAFQRQNLAATGVADLAEKNKVEGLTVGLNYLDDAMQLGFYYSRDFAAEVVTQGAVTSTRDVHRFMFRFNLRTIGELTLSQNVSNWFNPPSQ
ncbi:LPS-assembly protein LptD [Phreatobacter oligotrophus]|uniref:LPS-assembly protein LptD n=1 Tax=Phreatobacter oligotrophus TaxID=1122261 RepID=A0A2T4ZIE2_9HYPH|nr:LPS-assembly protein LptD [Phreatobacter oligotrophus]PTM61752.1 LPS-assembly protein [Phreatobacter oligotrophus]